VGNSKKKMIKYCIVIIQPETTTIEEIKTHISHEWNIPVQYQHLTLENNDLTDSNKPLSNLNLEVVDKDEKDKEIYLKHAINLELITPKGGQPLELEDEDDNLETKPEEKKKSNVDKDYLSEDSDSEIGNSESRPSHGLAGLKNQGATCYLNSLFQTFYLTPEFRKMIYDHPSPFSKLLPQYLDANYDVSSEDNKKNRQKIGCYISNATVVCQNANYEGRSIYNKRSHKQFWLAQQRNFCST